MRQAALYLVCKLGIHTCQTILESGIIYWCDSVCCVQSSKTNLQGKSTCGQEVGTCPRWQGAERQDPGTIDWVHVHPGTPASDIGHTALGP